MEYFDIPGSGKGNSSYNENDSENHGDSDLREGTGVDLYKKATGVIVGYNQEGEWLEYTVNVKKAGEYTMFAAVASANETSSFQLSLDDENITDVISVPKNDGEDNYDDYNKVSANVTLPEGTHVLRFTVTGSWMDIDYITFVEGMDATDPEPIIADGDDDGGNGDKGNADVTLMLGFNRAAATSSYRVYSLNGDMLGTVECGRSDILKATSEIVRHGGVYVVRPVLGGLAFRISVAK